MKKILTLLMCLMLCFAFVAPVTASAAAVTGSVSGASSITEGNTTTYTVSATCNECKSAFIEVAVTGNLEIVSGDWTIDGVGNGLNENNQAVIMSIKKLSGNVFSFKVKGKTASGSQDKITVTIEADKGNTTVVTKNVSVTCASHSYSEVSRTPATCTTDEKIVKKCTKCGHEVTETGTKAKGHVYDSGVVTKEATCTTDGVKTYSCKNCPQTKTETIKALGHSFSKSTVTKKPTCTEAGTKEAKCETCGKTLTAKIDASGHDFEDPKVVKEASLFETGLIEGKCKRCGESTKEVVPCGVKDETLGFALECQEGAFKSGSEFKGEVVSEDNEKFESVKTAINSLEGVSVKKAHVLDLAVLLDGESVNPASDVTVKFNVPEGFGPESQLYFVSEDGVAKLVESSLSEDGKTIKATVSEFGTYAIVETGDAEQTSEGGLNTTLLIGLGALLVIALVVVILVGKKKKDN